MKVFLTRSARSEFNSLSYPIQARAASAFKRLSKWPAVSGWKPMRGNRTGNGRLRFGDWRLIFRIPGEGDDALWVVKIGHRSEVYDD